MFLNEEKTLFDLVESIQKKLEGVSSDQYPIKLTCLIGQAEKTYDLSDQERKFLSDSFTGLEEQAVAKTMINAAKAKEIILKRKSK